MSRIVGIDLGTTNSLVAYMEGGQPRIISVEGEARLVPSVVYFDESGAVVVGERARRLRFAQAGRTVFSIKRFMGKGYEEAVREAAPRSIQLSELSRDVARIRVGDREYTPPEISALILKELRRRAEAYFGEPVEQAVITVPAYFNDSQRQATKDAGRIAGLEVLRIVNEPTAASLAYGLDKRHQGQIAVYDLGGGTFDISILKLKDGIFEVLSTNGDTNLGGDDFDFRIMELILREIRGQHGVDLSGDPEALEKIREVAESAKCFLSEAQEVTISLDFPGRGLKYARALARRDFEAMIEGLLEKTIQCCRLALADAKLAPAEIDEVVLVGGSTRIPRVRRAVQGYFGRPPHTDLNPDEVVALGAAIQADILAGGTSDMLLLDVTPLSLGIETFGGVMSKLIERNTTIPTSVSEVFTTFVDGQTSVDIHVLQGERELAQDCRSLARFQLKDIPSMAAGMPRIEVTFQIDANGILSVTARDQRTGKAQSIEVRPSHGLTDEEVEQMILESIEHGEEDIQARLLIEARLEADTVIRAAEKSLAEGRHLITSEEAGGIEAALAALRQAREGTDHTRIREAVEELDRRSLNLAQLLMTEAIGKALKDKTVEEVDRELSR
ncbi:MAG: molecular chaperone DnaK [Deltaproteobacteria bacterium]|nr:molecular chaperone DnaK [Deltaproteobacteria bacterium]